MLTKVIKRKLNKKCDICDLEHETVYIVTNDFKINFVVCEKCKNKLSLLLQQNKNENILLSSGEIY